MWKEEIFVQKLVKNVFEFLNFDWMNKLFSFQNAKFIRTSGYEIQPLKKRQCGNLLSTLPDNGDCEIEDKSD